MRTGCAPLSRLALTPSARWTPPRLLELLRWPSAQAETLRNQVAAAAQASTVALAAALEPIQKDIADLRRVQYEQQGQKSAVVEQRSSTSDLRNLWIGVLGVLILAATFIAPHIH